ncbi:MAG: 16S rRNA (cytosine(1402)-N(4))-methyltransferase RsmH [Defluviitaleaceae bacterium]|nr:16S rRNA (cytosine(1402)-N(4))-methyltransferase RsmH [Defluviitaleaceae bacterium]
MDYHKSVLLNESINALNIKKNAIYVDGTFGGGGHTNAIAAIANFVVAIDQDEEAIKRAIPNEKIKLIHSNFSEIKKILHDLNIDKIDGMLLDLGVSSHQIDTDYRGFSYRKNGKLDMRMDRKQSLDAYEVINTYSKENLTKIFKIYGEEPFAPLIAKQIILNREIKNIETTNELQDIILNCVPKKFGLAPVKRIFQAVRIEVNRELEILEKTIYDIIDCLNVGGRLAIITFHSLEDRIVKKTFNDLSISCICPRDFPVCNCNTVQKVKILTKKPILPTNEEILLNSRAKSSKLRIVERL